MSTLALEVGQRDNCRAGEGSLLDGSTQSSMEAGEWGCNLEAREGQLHTTQGLPFHLPAELHGEGG